MKPIGMPARNPGPLPTPRPSYSNGLLGKRVKCVFQKADTPGNAYVNRLRGKLGTIVSHPFPEAPEEPRFVVAVLLDSGEIEGLLLNDLELVGESA